jgi:RNA polymerase sigma-70 factor (ECF subfamily)
MHSMRERTWSPAWAKPMNGGRTAPAAAADIDGNLIARFLAGERSAFDELFAKYQDYVYNIVYGIVGRSEEAHDVSQEVFVQVYRSLPSFRRGSRFATWLYRIAVNRAVDAARASKGWRLLPLDETLRTTEDPEGNPVQAAERGSDQAAVQRILMQVPVQHRDILVLRYYQDLSVEEIAEVLHCSEAAAKVRLHRARLQFKEKYVAAIGQEHGTVESLS